MLTTTTTQALADMPQGDSAPETEPLDPTGGKNASLSNRFDALEQKATAPKTEQQQTDKAEATKKPEQQQQPDKTEKAQTDSEIDDDSEIADKDLAKAMRDLMAEGDGEKDSEEPKPDEPKTESKPEQKDKNELDTLSRQERYYYDKAKGDPVRMAKNLTQAEQHIADQKAELAKLMEYASSTQPKFDMAGATERAAEELREENPEWSESKVSRAAKVTAQLEKEEFESERAPEMESYQSFIAKQKARKQQDEQAMADARSEVENVFLEHTEKNTGLTRYALEKAIEASRDSKKKMDLNSILDEAQTEFETHVIEHLKLSPSFGPKLNAVIESIASKNEALEKKLAISFLRKNIKANGSKSKNNTLDTKADNSKNTNNQTKAAFATGNKRSRRNSIEVDKDSNKVLENIFTRLGIK